MTKARRIIPLVRGRHRPAAHAASGRDPRSGKAALRPIARRSGWEAGVNQDENRLSRLFLFGCVDW